MTKTTGFRVAHRPHIIGDTMACMLCAVPKILDDFSETSRNVLGRMHACKDCNAERLKLRLCRPESYFKHLSSNLKHVAKAKRLAFNLDWAFLKTLYEQQLGLCFYTDVELRTLRGQGLAKSSLSVDKIVPELGYVRTNVVLVTKRANVIKNDMTLDEMREWMPTWFARLQEAGLCS
jgi:hypothetical protein